METANTAPRRSEDSGELTVGQVAGLVGVSVRTLHHWDEIGLVVPSARSWAGYRLYGPDDVARIHRVLVYRETGMPLAEVARVLDDPDVDATAHLARQRDLLQARIAHLTRMLRAVDTMMERNSMGENLTPQQQAEILGAEWDPAWQEEAEERWGDSDEWAQAAARKAAMTRQDWARVAEETEALEIDLANAMREGVVPGSERANALAERHRASIDRWFDTTYAKQVLIARGYVANSRFTAYYDKRESGLAAWIKEIIDANAAAHGVDPANAVWQ
jgi:transcriptional regulator, MerR family